MQCISVVRLSLQLFTLKIRHELRVANQQCCSKFSTSRSILKFRKMDGTDHLTVIIVYFIGFICDT